MLGFRLFFIGILASAVIGAGVYVMKLRSDNAILKANAIKLESAVAEQQELITQQKEDFKEILAANQKMNELVSALKKDLDDLDKRFNKKNRDFGKLSIEKTKVMERIINFIREFIAVICITFLTLILFMILLFGIILAFIQFSFEETIKWIYKKFSIN